VVASNAEVIRRIYEMRLLDQPDRDQFLSLASPDIEWVNPADAVDAGVRRGRDEVWRAMQNVSKTFESSWHELQELFEVGEAVVASVTFHARVQGSDVEITQQEAHTWTLREGLVVRVEWGRDLRAALDAAAGSR
jgi:ketosteroid isomerase-like protein